MIQRSSAAACQGELGRASGHFRGTTGMLLALLLLVTADGVPSASAQPVPATAPPSTESTPVEQPSVEPADSASGPTYWARDFSFNAVNISTVLTRLGWVGIDVPVDAEGTVSVDATLWVPFGALASPRAYRLEGRLTSPRLRIESVVVSGLELDFRLDDGILQISRVSGTVLDPDANRAAGTLVAQGSAQLVPLGALHVSLQLDKVDLPYVLQRVEAGDLEMSGLVSGRVQLENGLRTAASWPLWEGGGQVRIDGFQWQDRPVVQIGADALRITEGRITSDSVSISSPTMRVAGSGAVDTTGVGKFALNMQGDAVPLEELLQWGVGGDALPQTAARLAVGLKIAGDLTPLTWQAAGTLRGPGVRLSGLELGALAHRVEVGPDRFELRLLDDASEQERQAARVQSITARYAVTDQAWRLSELEGQLWGGQVRGSAVWSNDGQGQHQVDLQWSDLAIDYQFANEAGRRIPLHADTSGRVQWSAPVERLAQPAAHRLTATTELRNLTLGGSPIGQLTADTTAADARWQASAMGTLLGGDADLQLTAQIPSQARWQDMVDLLTRAAENAADGAAAETTAPAAAAAATAGEGSYRVRISGASLPLDRNLGAQAGDAVSLQLDLSVSGELFPFDFAAQGNVRSEPLEVVGLRIGPLAHRFAIDRQRVQLQALPDADASVVIHGLQADYAIGGGAVRLSRLNGQLWGGQVSGDVQWMTEARGQHRAQLQWQGLDIRGRLAAESDMPRMVRLATSGQLDWSVAAEAVEHPAAHQLVATAEVGELTIDGQPLGDLRLTVSGQQQRWSSTGRGSLLGKPVGWQFGARIPASATWGTLFERPPAGSPPVAPDANPYRLTLQTQAFPVDQAAALLSGREASADTALALDLDLTIAGALAPLTWQAHGTARSPTTMVAGFDLGPLAHRLTVRPEAIWLEPLPDIPPAAAVGTLSADYQQSDDGWQVDRLEVRLWGGDVHGSGRWIAGDQGRHQAQLRWQDLMVRGRWPIIGDEPTSISAATNGNLQWSAPADTMERPAMHRLEASLRVDPLTIDAKPIGNLTASLTAEDGRWSVKGEGNLLGGPAQIQLQAMVPDAADWRQFASQTTDGAIAVTGQLDIGPVQASRLFALWQPPHEAQQWSGRVQLNWQMLAADPGALRSSRVEVVADALQHGQNRLTDRLTVQLLVVDEQVVIQSLNGSYAGGRIGATGRWGLGASASQVVIQLYGIDAARAVLPVSPDLGEAIAGSVSGRLVVSDGDALTVTGSLEMRDARVAELPVDSLRTSVTANVWPGSLRWSVQMRDIRGRVAHGRLQGRVSFQSSAGGNDRYDLDSDWQMDGVDFEELLDALGSSNRTIGRGVLTGSLTLSGRRVQSTRDLRGELQASLAGSDATAIPGLVSAQNYLGAFSLRNTRFDAGGIHGRISHGEFQIRELWLVGDQLRVWGEGEVALASGRMDMNMIAATGSFEKANPLLLSLARQFALDAALPVSLVLRANELLSDRVIRLQLYGTFGRPQVRINPVSNLGANAARFFLRSIAGDLVPLGGAAASAGRP